jgi:DNA-binding beta-propeller fold protein YncE
LYSPCDIFLDEDNSLLYVADLSNNRIQVFHLNGTPPYNGTTVAGGNGPGSGSHQLNGPAGVWASSKTGAIYIADTFNSRIQKWSKGATSGVTLAGSPYGNAGSNSTMLNSPTGLSINANETRMYVADSRNGRIQRFDLI